MTRFFKNAIIFCRSDTDNGKRSSVFTVRDAENAMITFTVFAIAVIVGIFLHEIVLKRNSITDGFYAIGHNISEILSAVTLLTLLDEGVDIMFLRRTREERRKNREDLQQVLEIVEAWNTRKNEAEARGETFTEPPPGQDTVKLKKKRFIFF